MTRPERRFAARPYDGARDAVAWDAFVRASRQPHLLFHRGFLEHHADRFEDASLVLVDEAEPESVAALLPASRHGNEVRSHGGLTFGGLVTPITCSTARTIELLDAVRSHLAGSGIRRLRYKPVPWPFHARPAEDDLYALTQAGARLVQRDVASLVDLTRAPKWAKSRRAMLARGRRSLSVARSSRYAEFLEVETAVLARHGATPVHSATELELLHDRFPDDVELWAVTTDADVLVGGIVALVTPTVVHTQYMGANDEGRDNGALDLAVRALVDAYSATHHWLSFGINSVGGRDLNVGLAAQKAGFGAGAVVFDQYELAID